MTDYLLRLAWLCCSEPRNPHVHHSYIPVSRLLAPCPACARDGTRAPCNALMYQHCCGQA